MKKNLVFALVMFVLFLPSCKSPLTPEEAASAILAGERERIPLYMQEYDLTNLTVDSIHFLSTVEPMSALLYTTWTYNQNVYIFPFSIHPEKINSKTQSLIIEIHDIQRSEKGANIVEWYCNWNVMEMKIERNVHNYKW